MGRPPCCDRMEVKRGPWTPEEDIMLVSYVQEHGPGNWRSVSSSTGLLRCSKSCRLRWTNYLRPGIKRGSFTDQEEKMIIQLQALLGNKWAAIASYLPERTDNDIKNYWNTHLMKKLRKLQEPSFGHSQVGISSSRSISRGQWERRLQTDINRAKQDLNSALSLENPNLYPDNNSYIPGTIYASSTENISRLLQGWLKDSPNSTAQTNSFNHLVMDDSSEEGTSCGIDLSNATFESILGFESEQSGFSMSPEAGVFQGESKLDLAGAEQPFSVLENWLLDEGSVGQVEEDLANFSFDESLKLF